MLERSKLHLAPAFETPPHARCPSGAVVGWLLDAPGALVQCAEPMKATVETATWLVHTAFDVLDRCFPQRNDLVLVLDLHLMVARTTAARSILLNSAKALGPRFSNIYVVPPAAYPAIYLQAFQASLAIARLLGLRVTLASSSAQLIERYQWQPLGSYTAVASASATQ